MTNGASKFVWDKLQALRSSQGSRAVLARGATGAMAANVAGAGVAYGAQVLLARLMGSEQYGIYAYVVAWLMALQFVGMFGVPQTIVRFGAAYAARDELGLLRGLLRWADRTALGVSMAVGAVMLTVTLLLPEPVLAGITPYPGELRLALMIGAGSMPIAVLKLVKVQTLRAFGGGALSVTLERLVRPTTMIVLALLALPLTGLPLRGSVTVGLYLASFATVGVLAVAIVRRRQPANLPAAAPQRDVRAWLDMALPSIFISGMSTLLGSTDRVMIGMLRGTEEAGVYTASVNTAMLVSFGLTALNAVLAPMVSSLHSTGKHHELQRILTLAAWTLFAWTALGSTGLLVFGPWILSLFGKAFLIGTFPLYIMVMAQIVNSSAGSVGLLLNMTGHQKFTSVVLAAAAALNVLLNFVLIPRFGMNGAAAATGTAMVAWNAAMLAVVHRKLHLNPTIFRLRFGARR